MTSTADQIAAIPDLITHVIAAHDTPARDHSSRRAGTRGSTMPPTVACHAMLADMQRLLAEAVRVAAEEMRDGQQWEPEPPEPPTWAGDCGWLLHERVQPWWQSDGAAEDMVASNIGTIHVTLSRWIGERTTPRAYRCPQCGGAMLVDRYLDDGQQLGCTSCGHIEGAEDVAREAVMRTPMPLPRIAALLGVAERTLRRWASLVEPVSRHKPSPHRPALYRPSEFARIKSIIIDEDGDIVAASGC